MIIFAFLAALLGFLLFDAVINFRQRTSDTVDNRVLHDQTLAYHLDWDAIRNQKFLRYLYVKKINAIVRYQTLAGVSHDQAEEAVEYLLAHPELLPEIPQKRRPPLPDADNQELTRLIETGQIDRAIATYAKLVEVDQFTAQQVIQRMERELYVVNIRDEDVYQSLQQDNETDAIQLLQERYGLSESEAIHAIDTMTITKQQTG